MFDFGPDAPTWTHVMMFLAVGAKHDPGMARSMRLTVNDKAALRSSLARMMTWDFDRLIVGHGAEIDTGAKARVAEALKSVGYYAAD